MREVALIHVKRKVPDVYGARGAGGLSDAPIAVAAGPATTILRTASGAGAGPGPGPGPSPTRAVMVSTIQASSYVRLKPLIAMT